ncbi:MAG: CpsD/CapB family tyrosine-protein kinase [Deferribacteres bacterium]|nr:CpsD/CapB family tyrosine-protein kinase [candidate division KSB1 bacterium]MCB9503144.1 CpsD/CapB family tyrosine-protein kinase [Deferribacteres bacterium]
MGLYTEAFKKAQDDGRFDSSFHGNNVFAENLNTALPVKRSQYTVASTLSVGNYQAIGRLHEKIEYLLPTGASRVIAFCGCSGNEGTSAVAHNLSAYYAQHANHKSVSIPNSGKSVPHNILLIDCNLHSPQQHTYFNQKAQHGLAEIIETNAPLSRSTSWIVPMQYGFISAGRPKSSISGIFKSDKVQNLLKKAKEAFTTIILDFAAITIHPDIIPLLSRIDGVMLVCKEKHTKQESVLRAQKIIEQRNGKLLGLIINTNQ